MKKTKIKTTQGNKEIINFDRLNALIVEIEALFADEGLNIEEQALLIKKVNDRITSKFQRSQTENLMQGFVGGGLFKSLINKGLKDKEND